jgi:hypothetical protein
VNKEDKAKIKESFYPLVIKIIKKVEEKAK